MIPKEYLILAKCIGAFEDGANLVIYWFVHDPSFTQGATGKLDLVVSFDVETGELIYHVISIDNGDGIDKSIIKTIFKPGVTSKKRGWGLGLSLSKRIIEDYHKGRIFVESSVEGEGTTFCISLPTKS